MEKYNENPSDLTLLSKYSELLNEMAEWSEKSDEISDDLSTEEALEFSEELLRIAEKLSSAY